MEAFSKKHAPIHASETEKEILDESKEKKFKKFFRKHLFQRKLEGRKKPKIPTL